MLLKLPLLILIFLTFPLIKPDFALAEELEVGEPFQVERGGSGDPPAALPIVVKGKDTVQYDELKDQTDFKMEGALPKLTTPEQQQRIMEEGRQLMVEKGLTPASTDSYDPKIAFPEDPNREMKINMAEGCRYMTIGTISAKISEKLYQEYRVDNFFTRMFSLSANDTPYKTPATEDTGKQCQDEVNVLGEPEVKSDPEGRVILATVWANLGDWVSSWAKPVFETIDDIKKFIGWDKGWTLKVNVQPIVKLDNEIGSIPELSYATGANTRGGSGGSSSEGTDPDWTGGFMRLFFTPEMDNSADSDIQKLWSGEPVHAKAQVSYDVDGGASTDTNNMSTEVRGQAGTELAWNYIQCSLSLPEEGCVVSGESGRGGGDVTYITITSSSLLEIFKQAADQIGVPVALLKAIARVEAGRIYSYSEDEVKTFSTYGWWQGLVSEAPRLQDNDPLVIRGLGYNTCAYRSDCFPEADVRGPMQFEIRTWEGIARQIDFGHTPDRRVLPDAVVAAAKLLKNTAVSLGETSSSNWSEEIVKKVAGRYCGDPKSSACGGNYDNVVWSLYQQYLEEEN